MVRMHTMFTVIGTVLAFAFMGGIFRLATWNPGASKRREAAAEQRMKVWDARQRGKSL